MQTSAILTSLLMIVLANMIAARNTWLCTPCRFPEECNQEPLEYCYWGESRDSCNRRVCAKGPGERCGGPMQLYGHCGEGMMCKTNGRCHGCSENLLECFP